MIVWGKIRDRQESMLLHLRHDTMSVSPMERLERARRHYFQ